jgi:flagellar hook protein FlgE
MNISNNVNALRNNFEELNNTTKNIKEITLKSIEEKNIEKIDLANQMVDLIEEKRINEANIIAIKTQDDILGTLIDIKV